jgi:UTP--glucose-1-phosphate uridylyltransferase
MVELVEELTDFYERVSRSNIVFVNQPEPRGFGNAVFHAKHFAGKAPFLVYAGDDLIISKKNQYLQRLMRVFESHNADAVLYVKKVKDPQRYGVVAGRKVEDHLYRVERIEEKPITPLSHLAIIAVYVFSSKIYGAIEKTVPDSNNEIQLTNAIQNLITDKHEVYALELGNDEKRIDIGTPESYWRLLKTIRV